MLSQSTADLLAAELPADVEIVDGNGALYTTRFPTEFREFNRARIPRNYATSFNATAGYIPISEPAVVVSTVMVYPIRVLVGPTTSPVVGEGVDQVGREPLPLLLRQARCTETQHLPAQASMGHLVGEDAVEHGAECGVLELGLLGLRRKLLFVFDGVVEDGNRVLQTIFAQPTTRTQPAGQRTEG